MHDEMQQRGLEARRLRLEAWRVMKRRPTFTSEDIVAEAAMTVRAARVLLRKLLLGSVIECVQARKMGPGGSCEVYRLAVPSHRVPRVLDSAYYWQSQAWQTMRIKRRFTASELLRAMEAGLTSRRALSRWLGALERSGFLRRCGHVVPGREAVYQIVRAGSPSPPLLNAGTREVARHA